MIQIGTSDCERLDKNHQRDLNGKNSVEVCFYDWVFYIRCLDSRENYGMRRTIAAGMGRTSKSIS